jgi:hypothetical protein
MSKLIVAVLTLLLGPAIAFATETYTVTEAGVFSPVFNTQFSFTEPTIPLSGDTTFITQISGAVVTEFYWNSAGFCPTLGGSPTEANACITYQSGPTLTEVFTPGSFLTDGTYTSLGGDETVMISGNTGATPEPSTVVLFVTGLVILVSRRNR